MVTFCGLPMESRGRVTGGGQGLKPPHGVQGGRATSGGQGLKPPHGVQRQGHWWGSGSEASPWSPGAGKLVGVRV
ncbi:hypothetical protein ACOMHN_052622 [Nucella lapillus]